MQTDDITEQVFSLAAGRKIVSHLLRQRPDCDCCFRVVYFDLIMALGVRPQGCQAAEDSSFY